MSSKNYEANGYVNELDLPMILTNCVFHILEVGAERKVSI
jgi:hypothetical protein